MTTEKIQRQIFKIQGMHCAACANLIDKFLIKQKGIKEVNANFGSESLNVAYTDEITPEQMNLVLKKLGYSLIIAAEEKSEELFEEERQKEITSLKKRVIISFILASPIVLYYMTVHMFNLQHVHALCVGANSGLFTAVAQGCLDGVVIDLNWIFFILTTPIQLGVGWLFYRNAWTAIRVGSTSMDVLVVLGTSAAYLISVFGFLFSDIAFLRQYWGGLDHPFWESSAALISFIVLGRYFEARSRGRVTSAIRKLMNLAPKVAIVIRNNRELEIPISEMKIDEIFLVKPGSSVPTDGIILEGKSSLDEKVITGESMPVGKTVGEEVIGATLNTYGLLKCRATKIGKETLLFQIIKIVREAQSSKAKIQDVADQISEKFVPVVIVFSVLVFVLWYFVLGYPMVTSAIFMIAVLVI
ncbi:heavy metal translocating P-type ATPase, partial [Candidatus Azambacteria bacterium]|nr:heavy metal translocating P-type ATPase [Candidatus Azambacteria bacterium]